MACLFGHKWNGCKCEKCGKLRDSDHMFVSVEGTCEEKCRICGKTIQQHNYENGICTKCGKESPYPVVIQDMGGEERYAIQCAMEAYSAYVRSIPFLGATVNEFSTAVILKSLNAFDGLEKKKEHASLCTRIINETKIIRSPRFSAEETELLLTVIPKAYTSIEKYDTEHNSQLGADVARTLKETEPQLEKKLSAYRDEAAKRNA